MSQLKDPIQAGIQRGWKVFGGALGPVPEKIVCDVAIIGSGTAKLGISAAVISRNVKGCWNLGSCGLGCPTNAKQSMLVTTISAALDQGAQLLTETQTEKFELSNGMVKALPCRIKEQNSASVHTGRSQTAIKIVAKYCVLAGGASNSLALLRGGFHDGAPGAAVR